MAIEWNVFDESLVCMHVKDKERKAMSLAPSLLLTTWTGAVNHEAVLWLGCAHDLAWTVCIHVSYACFQKLIWCALFHKHAIYHFNQACDLGALLLLMPTGAWGAVVVVCMA